MKLIDCLVETGIPVNRVDFNLLSEAAQLKVTDEVLTGMMKFITDKYNALDLGEIEKSAGDIKKFKYTGLIKENATMLANIYDESADAGAKKYIDVVKSIQTVMEHLEQYRTQYSTLYKSGNGMVQLIYTSLVAGCLYATGALVSNTIRFVTTEKDTDCEVLYDEIPGSIRQVHIKNILVTANSIDDFGRLIVTLYDRKEKPMTESITLTSIATGVAIAAGVIYLIPKILTLIREIIYSVYYSRVKVADMLQLQSDLIRTNIESLEAGRGNKKVIARQRRIAEKLEKWKDRIAVRMDSTEVLKKTAQKKEDSSLRIDRNSPAMAAAFDPDDSSNILI